ncbi:MULTISPECIES: helix-turn-helix transcriptional regulator [Roseobacteraceae]|uniref:PBP superfamily domain protein n=1 Tax=Pseudosulfitobacter pseudonitzschiae TaxID=1402135 RepID=A0A221K7X3_9RHOB|nr:MULTISPECIES: helix-turn-helix transcriptional regulator [Roseobacteraceae]ASM75112.1 PBP superfamily domain protein [Pseudosulfitobacter pseudonitzschiae]
MQNDPEDDGAHSGVPSLMTTIEVADYLRVKQRTIYEMVTRQTIPFTRATGKLLFPRRLIDVWLEAQTEAPVAGVLQAAPIYAGSNDPLLEWALRQSGAGLAVLTHGSTHGLRELADGRAMLAGSHLLDAASGEYNLPAVRSHMPGGGFVMIHWARRVQGLLIAPGNPQAINCLEDVVSQGLRFAARTEGAGSQLLLDVLLGRMGLTADALQFAPRQAETHGDLATMIEIGEADCGIGLQAVTGRLGFVPLVGNESFDLVMRRRDYFEPQVQALLAFARTDAFAARAAHLSGYDVTELGKVRWNS